MDVLVVDPGELGELLATLLSQYGFSAVCVARGEDALAVALESRPKVIVVDAVLPDTGGLDLAELLRDELQAKAIVTYAPSLLTDDATAPPRLKLLDGSFVRPFRSLSLIEMVGALLHRPVRRLAGNSSGEPPDDTLTPQPLSSTEGYAIEELTEELSEDLASESIEILLSDEAGDDTGDGSGVEEFQLEDFDPNAFADDDVTAPSLENKSSPSTEAARPLDEVVVSDRNTQSFKAGELAELWQRVKERRTAPVPQEKPASSGPLTPRQLADLLDAFHQSQTTGELWLSNTAGPGRRVLLLRRGMVVGARSNIEGEDLVSLMKKRKAMSAEDADAVTFMLSQKLYRSAAEAVLGLDHVPERVVRSVLEEHVRRTAIGAFSWKRGRYHLSLDGRATKESMFADVHVGDIIVHAICLTESDEALRKAAPDDARFAPVGDAAYGLEHLRLSPAEARVVIAMDGTKTIGDLLTLHDAMPERTVRGLAAGLFCLNLTRLAGRGPAAARKISFF